MSLVVLVTACTIIAILDDFHLKTIVRIIDYAVFFKKKLFIDTFSFAFWQKKVCCKPRHLNAGGWHYISM